MKAMKRFAILTFVFRTVLVVTREINLKMEIRRSFPILRNYTVIRSPYLKYSNNFMETNFSAFGQNICLKLREDTSVEMSSAHVIVNGNVLPKVQSDIIMKGATLVKGYDANAPQVSFAFGKIQNDKYDGYVSYKHDVLFVEPLEKYLHVVDKSIVYRKSDVKEDYPSRIDFLDPPYAEGQTTRHLKTSIKTNGANVFHRQSSHFITKRSSQPSARSCSLHVVADPDFYKNIGGSSLSKTISEMRYQVAQADMIFRSTDFDGNGYGDNIGFEISNITVITDSSYSEYHMADPNLSVYDYLYAFSEYDLDPYCLGVAFTYREFDNGVVGLAWTASSSIYGAVGGLCQGRTMYNGKMYSFNSALVTMLNYGKRLTSYKSSLVLTHEFGHNFGSPHDPDSDPSCTSTTYGNFIMYPFASTGSKPNEKKFSPCSTNVMYPVIVNKGSCLADRTIPSCGNGIIEQGEECDCGTSFSCVYTDKCCTPSDVTNSLDPPCTFRRSEGKVCSPKTGICCEQDCTITPVSASKQCGFSSECRQTAVCDGSNPKCPSPTLKPDNTSCESDRKFCYNGTCTKSACERKNLVECQCTNNFQDACKLCCKSLNATVCRPANELGILSTTGKTILLASGTPCNNFRGFCNSQRMCISEDPNDVIERLKNAFSSQVRHDIGVWMKNSWYYVFFGFLSLTMLIILFIGCRKKQENVQGRAYRQGRFEQVMAQARIEKEKQEKKMSVMAALFDKKIGKIKHGHERLEYTYAVVRLSIFFPTATKTLIQETLARCTSEDVAVRHLLISGYPMRRMIYTHDIE
ncbi:disintegrin and metalloproteinase domain-containing protein 10-like [Saccostrea echinata]|uniref:disintegrin and metalloproteinase domain-containing protein 10-like n=1 Tax=Saccostrea echinata TaxID=191078 RepID=UPI002A804697|nr:disintegrin and metalloproteinase domain-containing protein 10-like [Saccostrea echinata]